MFKREDLTGWSKALYEFICSGEQTEMVFTTYSRQPTKITPSDCMGRNKKAHGIRSIDGKEIINVNAFCKM